MSDQNQPADGDTEPRAPAGTDGGDMVADQGQRTSETPAPSEGQGSSGSVQNGSTEKQPRPAFPVVGIGASAGGLAAIQAFFTAIKGRADGGMAFVLVQHLDPSHESILVDLVRQYTHMPVYQAVDAMEVQPDCVYVIPPDHDIALGGGRLHLLEPNAPRGLRLPIDFFFRSLAKESRDRAICIVLSGTGSDGTLGLKSIKEAGGMAMVQAPESAAYDGMPRSAIASHLVDYVLPPDQMPEQLIAYVEHGLHPPVQAAPAPPAEDVLQKIFVLLRTRSGHDFSGYKRTTIQRRIERRMAVAQIDRMVDYQRYLQEDQGEVQRLFRELLIGVTNFFRDPDAFAALQRKVIPELFATRPHADVRIWVPACSSGEEAYSLAILMREYLDQMSLTSQVQIFATDIDDEAIDRARAGVYPESIAADVAPERLDRFFVQEGANYRVGKAIRDMVVFAKQDVLKDPPFSRIDLVSFRNLLIYLNAETQKGILQLFYYALNDQGFLFLGNSETVGDAQDWFTPVDKKWRIYQRQLSVQLLGANTPHMPPLLANAAVGQHRSAAPPERKSAIHELAERVLLDNYIPASVLVDANYDVLYIHGRTGKYLEPASGEASLNLLRMAREGLRIPLTLAVRQAIAGQTVVRHSGVRIVADSPEGRSGDAAVDAVNVVNLIVHPVAGTDRARGAALVIFEDAAPAAAPEPQRAAGQQDGDRDSLVDSLQQELRAKEDYLHATVEELQTTNEELKSTNEEFQSANEELQSTNEELSTSKEELQSVNEELQTVNAELQEKIGELGQANNDLSNLLASTGIGTLFVDHQLRVQRFTPATRRVINLIQSDIGRPVSDIVSRLRGYDQLAPDLREVLRTLIPKEMTVQSQDGVWYLLRIQPYRTVENVIEGAVLTFVDITQQTRFQEALQASQDRLALLFELLPVGVCVLGGDGNLAYTNPAFAALVGMDREDLLEGGHAYYAYVGSGGTPLPAKDVAGARALREQRAVNHVKTGIVKRDGTVVWTDMSAVPVALPDWKVIVVSFDLMASSHTTEGPSDG